MFFFANLEISTKFVVEPSFYMPTLSASLGLFSNYGFNLKLPEGQQNVDLGTQLDNNLGYGVGFNLNIPIFNRFQTKNNILKSKLRREIAITQLETEKLNLEQTIEQAFLDVKAALKTYEAAKISLEAQSESFKNAQERFDSGAMSLFDYDLVRNRLVAAKSSMIRSKYDYVFKSKVLQFYAGELELE